MVIYLDYKRSYSYFNNLIIIFGFYKPFQRIININIKFYIKYLYIFYNILIGIFHFKTYYIGGREAKDSESSFKELVIIREKQDGNI